MQRRSVTGEYSVSLLQELLIQRSQWNNERQDLIHQLEVITEKVNPYCASINIVSITHLSRGWIFMCISCIMKGDLTQM